MSYENPFGEAIYSYSRAQAIEDGVLIDLSQAGSIHYTGNTLRLYLGDVGDH